MRTKLLQLILLCALVVPAGVAGAATQPKKPGKKGASTALPANGHSALYDWLMTTHDQNKDGKLDDTEQAAVQAAFAKGDFMALKLDTNANHRLEKEEIERVVNEPVGKPKTPKTKK